MKRLVVGTMLCLVAFSPVAGQAPGGLRLSLADALMRVDSASEQVGLARAGVLRAKADLLRARSGLLPQINGAATYTRTLASQFAGFASSDSADTTPGPVNCTRYTPNPALPLSERLDALERGLDCSANGKGGIDFSELPFGQANTYNFALSGSQAVFNPRLGGQRRAASAGAAQAEVALDAARTQAVLEATQAYFDAQLADRLAQIADSALVQAERAYRDTELAREVGTAAEFDLLRAGVARDNQRPVVIQRRAQRTQAFLRLSQLLDLPSNQPLLLSTELGDTSTVPVPPFAAAVIAAQDLSVEGRAPVRQAVSQLAASEALLASARGGRLPSLTLSGTYAQIAFPKRVFGFGSFVNDASVSLRMDVPLFTGGRLRADLLSAEALRDESELRLRQAREQAARDVIDVRTMLEAAEASWSASQGTTEQARRAFAIAEVRYREGISTQTELSDARLLLQQAEANRAQAARDLQVARVRAALLRDLPFSMAPTAGGF